MESSEPTAEPLQPAGEPEAPQAAEAAPPPAGPPAEHSATLHRIRCTLDVIGALGGPEDVGPEVDRLRALWLQLSSADGAATGEAVEALRLEALELDASLTHSWFRPRFEAGTFQPEQLEGYVSLRASSLGGSPRRERLELLATRLLAPRQAEGEAELLEPEEAAKVLARVLPAGPAIDPARATASVLWLDGASLRVLSYATLEELLGDRFFLDLFGFKHALRDEVLDPAVVQAAVRLNVAISTRIAGLCKASGLAPAQFDERIEELRQEAFQLLNEPPEPPQTFQRRGPTGPAPKPSARWSFRSPWQAAGRWTFRLRVAAVALTLLLAGFLVQQELQTNRLRELTPAKLANLSPLLLEASVSEQQTGPLLLGRFSDRWRKLTPQGRREQATKLRAALGQDGIRSALIFEGQSVALQLEHSRILLIR